MKRAIGKVLYIVGCIMFTLFLSGTQEAEAKQETLKVGYFDYEGFLELDANGEYAGYGVEYLEDIAAITGWDYEFVPGTWEECLKRLEEGSIDLLCTAQYSKDRAEIYDYTKYEAGVEYAMLLVEENNESIFYEDYTSFRGLRIGMMKDSFQNTLLPQYASSHGFNYSAVYFDKAAELQEALKTGEIDAFLTGSLQKISGVKIVARFDPQPFFFISSVGNAEIIRKINTSMEQIQTSERDYNAKLYDKYYGDSATNHLAFTRQEHEYMEDAPVLRVAYPQSWQPVSFYDEETGEFGGISAGLMEAISQDSGLRFSYHPVKDMEEAVELVQSGGADLICGVAGDFEQEARSKGILLTKPILEVPVTISMLPGRLPTEVMTIAIPESYRYLCRTAQKQFPNAQLLYYRDTEDCLMAVKEKEVDAAFDNAYILDQYYKYKDLSQVVPNLSVRTNFPICIGADSGLDGILRPLLNKVIAGFDDKEINEIIVRDTMQGAYIRPGVIMKQYILPICAFIMLCILAIALHSRKKIKRYAFKDMLTGYSNGVKFTLSANKLLRVRGSLGYAVVDLNIDKFKLINNLRSYEIGNQVLRGAAEALAGEIRPGELFCREFGDHFLLLLSGSGETSLENRIWGIVNSVTGVPRAIGQDFQFTVSCGVYKLEKWDQNINSAVGWASLARNSAKGHHSNWVTYYDDSMRDKVTREQEIVENMASALEKHEFEVYFQPKYQLEGETLTGAEALVRWRRKRGGDASGLIYPDDFIPIFESNGFVVNLDLYVFEEVCRLLNEWRAAGKKFCQVSVNLSRAHLSIPEFYAPYLRIMERYGISSDMIEIELTESLLFENHLQMVSLVEELKELGLAVSMDDFGSGYSSLNLLKDLPIDYLKMDKEFFNTASDSDRGKKVIESVIYMAGLLGIGVVAEGVETREQVDYLRSIHCDIVQGYFFARPMPPEDFAHLLD